VRIDTTKIGMLAETDIVEAVAERLARYQIKNVVLDTVMLAKSGDPLLSASAVETLRQRLLPQVSLITPNLPEAAALLDAPHARTEQEMLEQGRALLGMGCGAVLMKGGHLDDAESPDWLFTRDGEQRFTAPSPDQKYPRYRLYAVGGAGGPASALRGLGANRGGSQRLALGGAGAGGFAGSGARHRSGTPFPRLVVVFMPGEKYTVS
jgi:hydroxymethylpyrimidine/phosphomethylpyrimidine kinase